MPKARQATGTEQLKMSHHRIGKALNHVCLARRSRRYQQGFEALCPAFSGN
jgi:hypothetical protein